MEAKQQYNKIAIFGETGEPILSSSHMNILDGRITLHGKGFPLIAHKTIVNATGYQKDGIVNFMGKITLSTEAQLNMEIVDFKAKHNRRAYLKVRTDLRTTVLYVYSLGRQKRIFPLKEAIELRDISLGGIGFYSNRKYFKKQQIVVDFNELKKDFQATAIVLRRTDEEKKRGFKYKYGCMFIGLKTEEQRVLLEYVFKKEIENHKRKLEENFGEDL